MTAIGEILQYRSRAPSVEFTRACVKGAVVSSLVFMLHSVLGSVHWSTAPGCVLVGMMISFHEWGAAQLWRGTFGAMFTKPDSLIAGCTRLPFWLLAGGTGYTGGMLLSKRLSLMGFYDIPVKDIFLFGAGFLTAIEVPLYVIPHLFSWRKIAHRTSGGDDA